MEKFLELNSEQNHDDYCLAYVFTDRDFDDGVLGLAWVGAPSGLYTAQPQTYTHKRFRVGSLINLFSCEEFENEWNKQKLDCFY